MQPRNRFHSLISTLLLSTALSYYSVAAFADRPNIILILADDLGAEVLGTYGGRSYDTPRLDALAEQGLKFTHGYAQPSCTATRLKLMTGLYNFRNFQYFQYLHPGETTFAHILKDAGYRTAVAGTWQLAQPLKDGSSGASPGQAGFDDFLVWQPDASDTAESRYWGPRLERDGVLESSAETDFGPDLFGDYVVEYIRSHNDTPFLMYYPMALPHEPFVLTPDTPDGVSSRQQKYKAMVAYVDKLVGRVQDAVVASGQAGNTVLFFIGDNGSHRRIVSRVGTEKIRGGKGKTITQGIRVPFLAWGPAYIDGARVSSELVDVADLLPTIVELAGATLPFEPRVDGVSLVPILQGKKSTSRDSLFMSYRPWANRDLVRLIYNQRFKLYESGDFFDLVADPREQAPLDINKLEPRAAKAYRHFDARLKDIIEQQENSPPGRDMTVERRVKAGTVLVGMLLLVLWFLNRARTGTRLRPND